MTNRVPLTELRAVSIDVRQRQEQSGFEPQLNVLQRAFRRVCAWPLWARLFSRYTQSLHLNHYTIPCPQLPKALEGYRILFVSDTHLDVTPNPLERHYRKAWPEHDVVFLGGDVFDDPASRCPDTLTRFLSQFSQPVYAVLGNHDSIALLPLLEERGVTVLLNNAVWLPHPSAAVLLSGVDDVSNFRNGLPRAHAVTIHNHIQADFRIMLSHSPDFLPVAATCGYDLQLSGHTHGGQCRIMGRAIFKQTRYAFAVAGVWSHEGMTGFTTTGYGCSRFPIRNIHPEISLLTLTKGSPATA